MRQYTTLQYTTLLHSYNHNYNYTNYTKLQLQLH